MILHCPIFELYSLIRALRLSALLNMTFRTGYHSNGSFIHSSSFFFFFFAPANIYIYINPITAKRNQL